MTIATENRHPFNAAKALGDWDPAAERAGTYLNVFEDGREYTCFDANEERDWTQSIKSPMVLLDNGRMAHSHYIGSCMVVGDLDKLVLNSEIDAKFHCAHTPRTAAEAGIDAKCMKNFVSEEVRNGSFPRFRAYKTYPTAISVADLNNASESTKANYVDYFNMKWEEIIKDKQYLPSVKKATTGSRKGQLFNSTRTLVIITEDVDAKKN